MRMSFLHIYSKIGTASEKNRNNAELLSFYECKNRNLRQILALETMPATFFHNFFLAEYLACQAPANPGRPKNRPTKKLWKKIADIVSRARIWRRLRFLHSQKLKSSALFRFLLCLVRYSYVLLCKCKLFRIAYTNHLHCSGCRFPMFSACVLGLVRSWCRFVD